MKNVLITGAAQGLGKAIAKEFACNDYNLVLTYNTSKMEAEELKEELINAYNINVIITKCQIDVEDDIKKLVSLIKEEKIIIDTLVNNAAICLDSLYEDKTKENFMKTLEVNLVGTFLISKYIGDMMYENKSGHIINLTSTNGINQFFPMSLDYDASKAALISLTNNLSLQYSPYINVNAVAPGWVKTEKEMKDLDIDYIKSEEAKIFLNRFAEVEEVANVVYFLATTKASYINNSIIKVDGGMR